MNLLKLLASPSGRIDQRLFGWSILGMYAAWWLSPISLGGLFGLFRARDLEQLSVLYKLIPALAILQLMMLPYISACLHMKRLRDARRGSSTFIAMTVISLVALPAAAVLYGVYLTLLAKHAPRDPSLIVGLIRVLIGTGLTVLIAWPLYSIWVGLGRSMPQVKPSS